MSSESPAQWPGALFDPLLSLFFPINFPFLLISRERALVPVPPTFFLMLLAPFCRWRPSCDRTHGPHLARRLIFSPDLNLGADHAAW
jgi:hypothetical protein